MSCAFSRERLVELARGGSEVEAARHAASCPACARELAGLRKVLKAVREAPVARPSADFTARVLQEAGRIRRGEHRAEEASRLLSRWPWWRRPWASVAAASVLTASVSTGFWWALFEGPPASEAPVSPPLVAERVPVPPPAFRKVPVTDPSQPSRIPPLPSGADAGEEEVDLTYDPDIPEPRARMPKLPPAIPEPSPGLPVRPLIGHRLPSQARVVA